MNALLGRLLSPLRREWKVTRLADTSRVTAAELIRAHTCRCECGSGNRAVIGDVMFCADCGTASR